MWAEGPAVHPAQGNALGRVKTVCLSGGPTGQSGKQAILFLLSTGGRPPASELGWLDRMPASTERTRGRIYTNHDLPVYYGNSWDLASIVSKGRAFRARKAPVMVEAATATPRCPGWRWHLTIRSVAVLIASAALGIVYGNLEHDWSHAALAAISLWVVVGLAAQVHDLWRASRRGGALTPEERLGMAIRRRLAFVRCLLDCRLFRRPSAR